KLKPPSPTGGAAEALWSRGDLNPIFGAAGTRSPSVVSQLQAPQTLARRLINTQVGPEAPGGLPTPGGSMGTRGPAPKRSSERIRRNADYNVETVKVDGVVEQPPLDIDGLHRVAVDWYESLAESGQALSVEPSDWEPARILAVYISEQMYASRPSAQMLQASLQGMNELLVSEKSRRQVAMEIERQQHQAAVVDLAAEFRKRQAQ